MDASSIIIVVGLVLIFALYLWYAKIIRNKNQVYEALAGIDVQLENRGNLIPNILNIAKKFMEHERDLISSITELRTRCTADYDSDDAKAVKEHMELASTLTSEMGKLMISVEAYPELKSDTIMQQAQLSYNEIETKIAASRRFYNTAVGQLNNSIEIFPGNIVAKYANVSPMPFFEADEGPKAPVNATSILG